MVPSLSDGYGLTTEGINRMGRRVIPHWHDWKVLASFIYVPVLIALLLGLIRPVLEWFRTAEANEAMLASPAPIDGQRAYGYLKQICEIGPRTAGSEANTRQRKLVADHFTKMGGKVREQPFRARHPVTGERW